MAPRAQIGALVRRQAHAHHVQNAVDETGLLPFQIGQRLEGHIDFDL
ncbi:MAG: hypothetical protein HQL42_09670 [Alphaproteobacteria bacterium]|nr:hypothetical protein [Alphaproteobacteria bacterium]